MAILQKNDIQKAIDAIKEMEELIAKRKKKIKIADDSKSGWMTIQYLEKGEHSTTSSEECKRVLAAEESAEKEIENRKKQKRANADKSNNDGYKTFGASRSLFRGMP